MSPFELPLFELVLEVFVKIFEELLDLLLVPVTMPLYLSSVNLEVFEDEVVIGDFVLVNDFEVFELIVVIVAFDVVVVRGVNDDCEVKSSVMAVVLIGNLVVADVVVVDEVVVARTDFEISSAFLLPGDFDPINFVVFVVDVVVGIVVLVVVADVVVVAVDVVIKSVFSTMSSMLSSMPEFLLPVGFVVFPESFPFLGRESGETIRLILD